MINFQNQNFNSLYIKKHYKQRSLEHNDELFVGKKFLILHCVVHGKGIQGFKFWQIPEGVQPEI